MTAIRYESVAYRAQLSGVGLPIKARWLLSSAGREVCAINTKEIGGRPCLLNALAFFSAQRVGNVTGKKLTRSEADYHGLKLLAIREQFSKLYYLSNEEIEKKLSVALSQLNDEKKGLLSWHCDARDNFVYYCIQTYALSIREYILHGLELVNKSTQ